MSIRNLAFSMVILASSIAFTMVQSGKKAIPFQKEGVIVNIHTFFEAIGKGMDSTYVTNDIVSTYAFVTSMGIYAFLETSNNAEKIREITEGTIVRLTGKLQVSGRLLHIEQIERLQNNPAINLVRLKKAKGRPVSLTGLNALLCLWPITDLPRGCHKGGGNHLVAGDKIYHYLQFMKNKPGDELFSGEGYRVKKFDSGSITLESVDLTMKSVEVKALEFPGQYLLIESWELKY